MTNYFCHRCGYEASQRINLKHHLNRKKICKPILCDISIEDIKKHYDFEIKTLPQNDTKFQCIYCNKILSRYDNINRHIKTCKKKRRNIRFDR